MHQKRLAAGLRPDPLRSLSAPPDPLDAVERITTISTRSLVLIAGKGEGEWMCVEWTEMNERGNFKTSTSSVISNSGQNACLAPISASSLFRELKRSQTSFSGHKCSKNVRRQGSARTLWGSLSAPPEPLAAVGRINTISNHCLVPIAWKAEGGMDVRGMGRDE